MELALMQAVIRSWRAQDTNALVRHANNHRVCRNLRDRFPHPYTAADAERWIRTAAEAVSSESKSLPILPGELPAGGGRELDCGQRNDS